MIATGDGGAVVIIGSGAALKGVPNVGHYVAAKHTIVGLGRSLANELAPHLDSGSTPSIRATATRT